MYTCTCTYMCMSYPYKYIHTYVHLCMQTYMHVAYVCQSIYVTTLICACYLLPGTWARLRRMFLFQRTNVSLHTRVCVCTPKQVKLSTRPTLRYAPTSKTAQPSLSSRPSLRPDTDTPQRPNIAPTPLRPNAPTPLLRPNAPQSNKLTQPPPHHRWPGRSHPDPPHRPPARPRQCPRTCPSKTGPSLLDTKMCHS